MFIIAKDKISVSTVPDYKKQLEFACKNGFRHHWVSQFQGEKGAHLIRKAPDLSIFHRKKWLNVSGLEKNWHPPFEANSNLVLVGLGSGQFIPEWFKTGASTITILEKHPLLVSEFLAQYDVLEALRSGKIQFVDSFTFFADGKHLPNHHLILHPVLGIVYRDLVERIHAEKTVESLDVLMEGELLIDDWYDTLTEAKTATYIYPHFWLDPATIEQDLRHRKVSKMWSINRIHGLEQVAERVKKPYRIFEIDPDLSEIPKLSVKGRQTSIFTFRRSRADEYSSKGWRASYLPLAASLRMKPTVDTAYSCNVSFVGTSILGNAKILGGLLDKALPDEESKRLFTQFREHQAADPIVFQADNYFDALRKLGVPAELQTAKGPLSVRKILHEWSGALHRIHLVTRLAPFGVHVWGDDGWKSISEKNAGMIYRGPAGNRIEVPKIYSSSKINADITRNYQPDVATIRLFDVFACGSLCVTNVADESAYLYENPSLMRFTTGSELQKLVDDILHWSAQRYSEYVYFMKEQTLQKHTLTHRLHHMLSESSAFGSENQ